MNCNIYKYDDFNRPLFNDSRISQPSRLSQQSSLPSQFHKSDISQVTPSLDLQMHHHHHYSNANNNDNYKQQKLRDLMRTTTSLFEEAILSSNEPIEINETDEITIDGHSGILANKAEINEWRGIVPLRDYAINRDPFPEIVNKKTTQEIDYVQELAFRLKFKCYFI